MVASLALMGLAAASASAVSITPTPASFGGGTEGGELLAFDGTRYVQCKTTENTGTFTSGQAGTAQLLFKNCKIPGTGTNCTTAGQATGSILTKPLTTEIDYLYPENGSFGIGFKPTGGTYLKPGTFAEFSCSAFLPIRWTGGVIARITSPGLNTLTKQPLFSVSATGTEQTNQYLASDYKEFAEGKFTSGYQYKLSETIEGGSATPVGLAFSGPINFPQNIQFLP